ncbi:MAG TPA: NADH:flavin oxidoreductase/NADH oxidase [Micropepsaceae bacterium]|nr:NADH:flavin oxidoreductase/NADH oxidase [Micropepsaceae bacterium]
MPSLFSPFTLRDVTLRNRICVSPMCQYSAHDGLPTDWHLVHLGARAIGGAALVIAEATAVSPEGRITPGCTGLWSDAHAEKFGRIAEFVKAQGAVPGIQLAHAGRKASAYAPWRGHGNLAESDPQAWQPIGPSAVSFGAALTRVPSAMTKADIARVQVDFASAARRAMEAGFEWLELHFAHGYLGQSFLSPIANHRDDEYGGSFEGRARFILETFAAVRAVWPERLVLSVRLGITDFHPHGHPIGESLELVRRLKSLGLDIIDPSLGGNSPDVSSVPYGPAFMVPIAERLKREVGIAAAVSWQISEPQQAESIIRDEQTDLVLLARAMLDDPHWPFHAARVLGRPDFRAVLPPQYHRVT